MTKSNEFAYAPAPESRSIIDIKPSYGLFINGEFVDGRGKAFKTISPSSEEVLAEVAEADEADIDLAVKAARRAYTRVWSKMSGRERGKYLYRIARIIQERSRELAVLESVDNGKPIKESRDVDVPTVAAHFFYYAGWADKLDYSGFGTTPARRRRPGDPVELPAADAGLEDRAGAGLRQHRRAQARRDHAADGPALRRDLPAGRPAAGVVNIVTGAGETGRALVSHPDVDKVAFTGSTDVGQAIAKAIAGSDKKVTLELGGKAANIVFDDAPVDQAVEGIVERHLLQPGPRLLRGLAAAGAGVGRPTRCSRSSSAG